MSAIRDGRSSRIHRALLREHGYSPDPGPLLAAADALAAKCAKGEHDEQVVPPRYRVWSWRDKRYRETGERYCARCGLTIT